MGQFPLVFFEEVDVFGDAIHLIVVQHHLGGEIDKLAWMEAIAVCMKMLNELFGCNAGVE